MSEKDFDGQRKGETVEFVFRRHIMTASKGLLFLIIVGGLGFVPMLIWRNVPEMFWVFVGGIIIGLIGFLWTHMLWYFSVYIVTNERIRQIQQRGLFKKTVVDLGLDKIQSVAYDVPGVFGGLFNYGTILIQTQVGDMTISKVPKPAATYNKLQDLMGGSYGE